MKQKMFIALIFVYTIINTGLCQSVGSITDRDGNVYQTVQIGNQRWMAENLKTSHCDDTSSIQSSNRKFDGKTWQYNMPIIESCNICPSGWRMPDGGDIRKFDNSVLSADQLKGLLNFSKQGFRDVDYMMLKDGRLLHSDFRRYGRATQFTIKADPSKFGIVRCVQDIITILPEYPNQPEFFSIGDEGKRNSSEIDAGKNFRLEVIFVDWKDQSVDTSVDVQTLWKSITNDSKMADAFRAQGATVDIHLNAGWRRMPKLMSYYFPKDAGWNYQEYTQDGVKLLGADSTSTYAANTIAVIIPNKGAVGFGDVPSGAHGATIRGIRKVITLVPTAYSEHYTTMMHEIGHCFGSDELYPASFPYQHEVGGYDLMGDIVYATGFMGWHRYRYGWMGGEHIQYLENKGNYVIPLNKLSSAGGKSMVVIPDDKEPLKKYWVIEIGQDVVWREQFYAGKGEKLNTEGERLIVYTVEETPVEGKRHIRLVPRTKFLESHGTVEWLDAVSYKENQSSIRTDMPFTIQMDGKTADGFNITVSIKNDITVPTK